MNDIIKSVERKYMAQQTTEFSVGDTIAVSLKIREGDKERVQVFQGIVIQRQGSGMGKTITVRKASGNVYVERIFPLHSPLISDIKRVRQGRVRRARLFYLRDMVGKAGRIKEKK